MRMEPRPGIKTHHHHSPGRPGEIRHAVNCQLSSLHSCGSSESRAGAQLLNWVGQAPTGPSIPRLMPAWPFSGASQVTGERKMTNMQKHRNREAGPWPGAGGRQWGHWSVCELGMSSHQQCWKPGSDSSPHSCVGDNEAGGGEAGEGFLRLDENHACYVLLQPKTGSPDVVQADLQLVSCKPKDPHKPGRALPYVDGTVKKGDTQEVAPATAGYHMT